jgi:hypothetical protein
MALRIPFLILIIWNLPVYYLIRGWVLQGLGEVRLGWKYIRCDLLRFRFYSSHFIYRRCMRTHRHTAFTVLDRYDILYDGHKSDDGVGSGRRRRRLDWYRFRFSIPFWNVIETALRDSVVFSVAQTVLSTFDVYCAYGSAHTYSHLNYMNLHVYDLSPRWVLQGLDSLSYVTLG